MLSTGFVKDPTDPQFQNDADFREWLAWMKKYFPDGSLEDPQNAVGYAQAQTMVQVLKQCGDDLTRENLLRQATSLKGIVPPMFVDGIGVYNSSSDYRAIHHLQLTRFDGTTLVPIGEPVLLDG